MLTAEEILDCRKAAVAIYIATTPEVAQDISSKLNALCAHIIEQEAALRQAQAEAALMREALGYAERWFASHENALQESQFRFVTAYEKIIDATSSPTTSAYVARVQRMEEELGELQHALEYWQTVPCLSRLLGEDSDDDPPCGCASCWAKQALPLVLAALAEGEG